MYANQIRNTLALGIGAADNVARALRRNHDNVDILRRDDLLEVDVEAVRKCEAVAGLEVRLDGFLIDIRLLLVRNQHHNDVARLGSLSRGHNGQAGSLCLLLVLGTGTQADNNIDAGIMQVFRMRMALGTKADDGNGLAVQQGQVAVRIIVHLYHLNDLLNVYKVN